MRHFVVAASFLQAAGAYFCAQPISSLDRVRLAQIASSRAMRQSNYHKMCKKIDTILPIFTLKKGRWFA
jgi:hypothetical protein